MSGIVEVFTENPWPLFWLLALVELLLVVAIRLKGQGPLLKAVLVVPLLAVGLLVVEWLIVTDREQLKDDVSAVAQAVENQDEDRFLSHFAADFSSGALTRTDLEEFTRKFMNMCKVESVSIRSWGKINFVKGQDVWRVNFEVISSGKLRDVYPWNRHFSQWCFVYVRDSADQTWKIRNVQPVNVPYVGDSSLHDLGQFLSALESFPGLR